MALYQYLTAHPWIIPVVLVWSLPWKGVALWRAARRAHTGWFIVLLILNTFAILEILYIFIFSNASPRGRSGSSGNDAAEGPTNVGKRMVIM